MRPEERLYLSLLDAARRRGVVVDPTHTANERAADLAREALDAYSRSFGPAHDRTAAAKRLVEEIAAARRAAPERG